MIAEGDMRRQFPGEGCASCKEDAVEGGGLLSKHS